MAHIKVLCPECQRDDVIKFGFNSTGTQRYRCKNHKCSRIVFLLKYSRNGDLPEVKQKIIDMALNGSGIRDTARVLGVSINTVLSELKKNHRN
jgi:transposase-like protein